MDKEQLIDKISHLKELTNDEKSAILRLLRHRHKYGLVWEDKPEAVEDELKEKLPVLKEVKERAIINDTQTNHFPNHIIIEGDNLHAETVLTYTHNEKVDCVCIDPPYNTGNQTTGAFFYNDKFVDAEDAYKHSKWLCFMSKRLRIAKRLLKSGGLIIITIDDHEQSNLKLLCDEIFGESNMIGVFPTIMNLKGNQDQFGFAGTHEYTLVYTNNLSDCKMGQLPIPDEDLDDWEEDEVGFFKKGATLKRTGQDAPRARRPYGYFPILVNVFNDSVSSITKEEYQQIYNPSDKTFNDDFVESLKEKYTSSGFHFILPIINGEKASWRWGYDTVKRDYKEIIVTKDRKGNISLYKKQRPELGDLPSKKPKSVLYKAQYSSGNGTAQLKAHGLGGKFNNPKPLDLIVDLLTVSTRKDSIILDFFAGSGTTMEAVLKLNEFDGGRRTCILATDNEAPNFICDNVTYPRCKNVITGYTTPDNISVEGLHNNNLRYYKTDFVPRERTVKNMRTLVNAATDMLCIKENMYKEVPAFGKWQKLPDFVARHFTDGEGREMLIIYDENFIDQIVDAILNMDFRKKLKVYVFSPDRDPFEDEFIEVEDKVELCALPAAIYDAYVQVIPKPKDQEIILSDEASEEEEADWTNETE
jgi:adenine-specific DNA-methyltransferase